MQLDTVSAYVARRLYRWGNAMCGGGTSLDFSRTNILHRTHGLGASAPLSDEAWETEQVVAEIAKESRECADVLRTCYCWSGGTWEDRRRAAERALHRPLSRYKFWQLHDDAFDRAKWFLVVLARLAS